MSMDVNACIQKAIDDAEKYHPISWDLIFDMYRLIGEAQVKLSKKDFKRFLKEMKAVSKARLKSIRKGSS